MRALLVAISSALTLAVSATPVMAQEPPAIIPIRAWSELSVGPNRFLFSIADQSGQLLAAPDVEVHLQFYDHAVDRDAVAFEADSRFLWAIEGVRGLYAAEVEYASAGRWGTRFNVSFPDGREETVRRDYDVLETTSTPVIGAAAPIVDTPTAADVGGDLSLISSDPEPEPRFYELSIEDAIAADAPAIIAFVTPAFCQSATCGPTIEKVKAVAAERPDLNVVQVEPYQMHKQDGYLQPLLSEEGFLQPAPWTRVWGLLTEPYVVVLDADGIVRAKFEGAITEDELTRALDAL